jgi:peptidoglycan/xylan/chitin deacetylase (PgdA/CDA1 family)
VIQHTSAFHPSAPDLPVLMYHSISHIEGRHHNLGVPADLLRNHLAALTSAGYRLMGLSAALDLAGAGFPIAALTFDDAYGNFLTEALPVLAEFDASATLYVPAANVGRNATWLGSDAAAFGPILTWPELRTVARAGIEIGNHGWFHEPLDVLPPADAGRQISQSQQRISTEIGEPARSFAYPHGYNSAKVRLAVAGTGHDNACEVGHRICHSGEDRFAIPRLQPTPALDGNRLLQLIHSPGFEIVPRLKQLAQPGWQLTRRAARTVGVRLT